MTFKLAHKLAQSVFATSAPPERKACVRFELSGALHYLSALGYDWHGPAAIFLHETGFGTSHAAIEHNNLFGVSYKNESGKWVPIIYLSTHGCLSGFADLMRTKRYAKAYPLRAAPLPYLNALYEAGYNSNLSWRNGVIAAYKLISNFSPL